MEMQVQGSVSEYALLLTFRLYPVYMRQSKRWFIFNRFHSFFISL